MQFSMCTRIANTKMPLIQRSFFVLNARTIFAIFLRNWTQCVGGFSLLWQRYVRKGNAAKSPAILGFFNIERTQLNAAHAQLLEKLRFQEIWQKNSSQNHANDLSRKIWILTSGIFNNTENDLRRITKIAYVKILLEQCWQKGFNVNS